MGKVDTERQALNVARMRILGAEVIPVEHGSATLKDAINEALRDWVTNVQSTHYLIGTVTGPHPFPEMVRDFHKIIGEEARAQVLDLTGRLPDAVIACVGGGSNAMGIFHRFIEDAGVRLIGIEAGGEGIESGRHAARFASASPGVLHGAMSYLMQDDDGQTVESHSISAGLDYPSVGPEHSFLRDSGRAEYRYATDELVMEAFLAPKAGAPEPTAPVAPAFKTAMEGPTDHLRPTVHKLVDALLGALTGRVGGFASQLAYAARVGDWRTAYVLDADGFDLHPESPAGVTILSPTFGPGGQLFYALSANFTPFRVAATAKGLTFPFTLPGSVLGLTFSSDQAKAALTVMNEGTSSLWIAEKGVLKQTAAAPYASHPTFGPLGKLAYAGGSPVQRIYVDGKAVSPAGFMASSPVFCDTPEGLLVLFTVQVSGGADIIAMDSKGGSIRRFTQKQGSNSYPACSPDGRLIAFFSSTKTGAGSGLYLMPVARPWLAKKISNDLGESLQWDRRTGEAAVMPAISTPAR